MNLIQCILFYWFYFRHYSYISYSLHCTLYILFYELTMHLITLNHNYMNCILCNSFLKLHFLLSIMCIVFYVSYFMQCILSISTLYIIFHALYSIHFLLCIIAMHYILCMKFYALYCIHSIPCIVLYALYSMHCILYLVFNAFF